jgi:hypothetical protein
VVVAHYARAPAIVRAAGFLGLFVACSSFGALATTLAHASMSAFALLVMLAMAIAAYLGGSAAMLLARSEHAPDAAATSASLAALAAPLLLFFAYERHASECAASFEQVAMAVVAVAWLALPLAMLPAAARCSPGHGALPAAR